MTLTPMRGDSLTVWASPLRCGANYANSSLTKEPRMIKPWVALAVALCATAPTMADAQVFLASEPNPRFLIGPLFVVANVSPGPGPVTVNLSWSLTMRPGKQPEEIGQDLYLLWPAEIAESTAPGPAEPEVVREIEGRGFAVAGSGRLMLRRRDRMQVGTAALGDPIEVTASYASFARAGSQSGAVTYIKIPWTPRLARSEEHTSELQSHLNLVCR